MAVAVGTRGGEGRRRTWASKSRLVACRAASIRSCASFCASFCARSASSCGAGRVQSGCRAGAGRVRSGCKSGPGRGWSGCGCGGECGAACLLLDELSRHAAGRLLGREEQRPQVPPAVQARRGGASAAGGVSRWWHGPLLAVVFGSRVRHPRPWQLRLAAVACETRGQWCGELVQGRTGRGQDGKRGLRAGCCKAACGVGCKELYGAVRGCTGQWGAVRGCEGL